jgi:hypothetical protein
MSKIIPHFYPSGGKKFVSGKQKVRFFAFLSHTKIFEPPYVGKVLVYSRSRKFETRRLVTYKINCEVDVWLFICGYTMVAFPWKFDIKSRIPLACSQFE